ncbi:ubiquitin domain-containing protein dsk2 [Phtheirospermum japonicum]|uniref:Ubiquitin domain-containing protein dsk2 n=1 Tax=Phtheirospermum japonicum TaxID=374723 RepID=A0A830BHE5_9LAMI|nr:ubiquitin domain-containing protein dsk2 [Phtheirospermum japonicum]
MMGFWYCQEDSLMLDIVDRLIHIHVTLQVPVPQLKEQIASLTGVVSDQQRLICRGKVLKDDQLLSAYHVEDGHTLHLVVRQPVAPSPELSDHPATDPTSSIGHNPHVMVGTFNLSEQGDGSFPDLNRILSAVLGSFGVARSGIGGEGIDLNQTPLERLFTASGLSGAGNSVRPQSDQVESLQPPIIPDSLTTLLQYASHLRQAFIANAGGQEAEAAVHSSEPRGILRPESLAEVMSSARQLLAEQASGCLSQLAGQLESHSSVMDPLERSRIQSNAIRSGALFQNLGAMLLELGRAIMTLRMGQTPADALVNAGPSVFVSSTGPNPIMVQPLPFQPGAGLGSVPVGSGLAGGPAATTGFVPRNIDIRIRTGSSLISRRSQVAAPQPANSGSQDAAAADPNSRAAPQVRAVPLRSVVAGVPAAASRRSTDTSRGSIGFLYPVLARVQQVSSVTPSNVNRAPSGSEALLNDQGFAAHVRGGLEQLFSTIFPGEHFFTSNPPAPAPPAPAPAPPPAPTQESAPVSDEGIMLSNILRQIMPMLPQNNNNTVGADSNEGETHADDGNPDRASSSRQRPGHQSHQPDSKRQKRE